MEELFENLSHSKRVTMYQTKGEDIFNYDNFWRSFIVIS